MKYGCIGEKLSHSFSVEIHDIIGEYEYELKPVERSELDEFMTLRDFIGINVTIPYKKAVMPYLDVISDEALACGAVNTVLNRDGKLYGFNTDFFGMKELLYENEISVKDKNVLILGSGGTSGTAEALCLSLGARRVEKVSRTEKKDAITYEVAEHERKDAEIIINTTPCGMYPNLFETAADISSFPMLRGVIDAVYNPLRSQLVLDSRDRGINAVGGLYMLVAQGVYAAEIFTGKTDIRSRVGKIYKKLLKSKENIVLIGMPGCGKTTVGKALSKKLGFDFVDVDDEIERLEQMPIKNIFEKYGEKYFRIAESKEITAVSKRQRCVIATGGGAILNRINVERLRANGKLVFLDAPLSDLIATDSRPLSSNAAELKKRYEERYALYRAAADVIIPVTRDINKNLEALERELK